jgi:hypothetical protein
VVNARARRIHERFFPAKDARLAPFDRLPQIA